MPANPRVVLPRFLGHFFPSAALPQPKHRLGFVALVGTRALLRRAQIERVEGELAEGPPHIRGNPPEAGKHPRLHRTHFATKVGPVFRDERRPM